MWGRLGNCPDTHTSLLLRLCDSVTIVELAASFSPSSLPPPLLVRARVYHFNIPPCSSSLIVKWAAIVHSHTHAPIEITGQTGAGESWGSTQSAKRVCGAIGALTFYNLRLQTSGQIAPLVSTPIDLIDRKWPFKGFLFLFCFVRDPMPARSAPPDLGSFIAGNKVTNKPRVQPQILSNCWPVKNNATNARRLWAAKQY